MARNLLIKWPLVIALSLMGTIASPALGCDESSPEVDYARSIPQERLARLYADAKEQYDKGEYLYKARSNRDDSPEWLSDIEYRYISLDRVRAVIVLRGCFDHFVSIYINGVNQRGGDQAELLLVWGEGPAAGKQVLWKE